MARHEQALTSAAYIGCCPPSLPLFSSWDGNLEIFMMSKWEILDCNNQPTLNIKWTIGKGLWSRDWQVCNPENATLEVMVTSSGLPCQEEIRLCKARREDWEMEAGTPQQLVAYQLNANPWISGTFKLSHSLFGQRWHSAILASNRWWTSPPQCCLITSRKSMLVAITISCGSEFHELMMPRVKKYLFLSVLILMLGHFHGRSGKGRKSYLNQPTFSTPTIILCTSILCPLSCIHIVLFFLKALF